MITKAWPRGKELVGVLCLHCNDDTIETTAAKGKEQETKSSSLATSTSPMCGESDYLSAKETDERNKTFLPKAYILIQGFTDFYAAITSFCCHGTSLTINSTWAYNCLTKAYLECK